MKGDPISQLDNSDAEALRMLIQDCIAWKKPAQRKLYDTYAPAIYNTIKRYVFNDDSAQEILNDTWYKIFTSLGQFSWQGRLEAWMRRIAVNTITDHLRKYIRDEHQPIEEADEAFAFVENEAVSNLSFEELVNCTYQLPYTHRAVFNLYILDGLTHKEIGAMLDISDGNSRWILNDARKRLKQIISSMK